MIPLIIISIVILIGSVFIYTDIFVCNKKKQKKYDQFINIVLELSNRAHQTYDLNDLLILHKRTIYIKQLYDNNFHTSKFRDDLRFRSSVYFLMEHVDSKINMYNHFVETNQLFPHKDE